MNVNRVVGEWALADTPFDRADAGAVLRDIVRTRRFDE